MSPAREFAFAVLLEVEERGGYASELLHAPRSRQLAPADRRLATELVLGVLRWRGQLDFLIARAARRPVAAISPRALIALRLGAYQLRFLSRIPVSAAVHESVELAKAEGKGQAGFVNAVLRHLPRQPVTGLLATELDLSRHREAEFSHPAWLLERWSQNFSPDAVARIAEYDNQPAPVAIRLVEGAPLPEAITVAPGRLLARALRVTAGDVTKTAAYREHRVWIQDEASQLIAYLLQPWNGRHILDACAAPGAKASLLHSLAPGAAMVALERHPKRAQLLRNLLDSPEVSVIVADAAKPWPIRLPGDGFDRILVDAPCTGTGTLARNPEIRWRLQPDDPARLAQLQGAILQQAVAALAPGGRCVYSVCSVEPEEGPEVVAAVLAANPHLHLVPAGEVLEGLRRAGHLALEADAAALAHDGYFRVLPGQAATDGFFAGIVQRVG